MKFTLCLNLIVTFWVLLKAGNDQYDYIRIMLWMILLFGFPGWLMGLYSGMIRYSQEFWQQGLISFIIGSTVVTSLVYVLGHFYTLGNITQWLGFGLFYVSFGLGVKRLKPQLKLPILCWEDIVLMTLFNILLYCYIAPTEGLIVPPLHDPSANVIIADKLSRFGFSLAQFPKFMSGYPPGAAYWTALLRSFSRVDAARVVLFSTNFMNMMCAFSFGLFIKTFFEKKDLMPLGVIVLGMLSVSISRMYFEAGKNSQIFGYFFLFASFWAVTAALRSPRLSSNFLAMTTCLFAILTHYNNIIILPLTLFCITLTLLPIFRKYRTKEWCYFAAGIFYFSGCLLLMFWDLKHTRSGGHIISQGKEGGGSAVGIVVDNFWAELGNAILNAPAVLGSEKNPLYRFTALWGLYFALGFSVWTLVRKRQIRLIFLPLFGIVCLIPHFLTNQSVQRYSTLNDFLPFLFFSVFGIYFVVSRVKRVKWLFIASLTCLLFFGIISLKLNVYTPFSQGRRLSPVTRADMDAFAWIKNNTKETDHFLPANIVLAHGVAFQTDGSMYLKVFAQRQELLGFTAGDVFEDQNPHDIELFQKHARDLTNPDVLKEYQARNINYVYVGPYHYWGPGIWDLEKHPVLYQKVYDHDGAKVFKINFPHFTNKIKTSDLGSLRRKHQA
ncbi:hypothetical protein WDW86_00805 [Bdellovibrionota bacterium FG-2]